MATAYQGRQRNDALRSLKRFDVTLMWEGNNPVFRVKPAGFATIIAELRPMPGAHSSDILDVGAALCTLACLGAK